MVEYYFYSIQKKQDPERVCASGSFDIELGSHKVYNPRLCKTVLDEPAQYHMTDDDFGCILVGGVFLLVAGLVLTMIK